MLLSKLLPGLAIVLLGASLASAATPVRILPIGDSLTDNFPGYRAPLFKKLAAAGYSVEFVGPKKNTAPADGSLPEAALRHAGHGGYVIGPGPSKADAWSSGKGNISDNVDAWLKSQPDIVLLLIGTNDFFNIVNQPDYKPNRDGGARLGALLDKIHAVSPKSVIVVSSVLPVGWDPKFAKGINDALPGLVSTRPYTVFADLAVTAGFAKGDWSGDNLHPSQQGYEKMAAAWFTALQPVLDARN